MTGWTNAAQFRRCRMSPIEGSVTHYHCLTRLLMGLLRSSVDRSVTRD